MQNNEQDNFDPIQGDSSADTASRPALKKKRVVKKRVLKAKPLEKPAPSVPVMEAPAERPKPKRIVFSPDRERTSTSKSTRFVPMVVMILFLGAIAVFAFNQKQSAEQNAEQTTADLRVQVEGEVAGLKDRLQALSDELQKQRDAKQEPKYNEYSNAELGIRFRYPQSVGQAKEERVDENPDETGDEYLTITFSANPDLWIMAAPRDYEGGRPFTYDGSVQDLASTCEKPLDATEDGYCDYIAVANTQTVLRVQPLVEEKLLNVVKSVPLNLTSPVYAGLTVNIGLGLPPVTGRDLFAPTSDDKQQDALLSFFRNLIKRESLSIVVEDNLKAHETVLSTIEFLSPEPSGS